MKICFTSYFGLREALKSATDQLEKFGHEILDYPLFMNNVHTETKVDNIVEHFSKFIEHHQPDGIFWWCLSIETDDFIKIKALFPNLKYWYFNWDEPYNWNEAKLEMKAPYFDQVFVSCLETTSRYINHGCSKATYCLPGFDPELFFPCPDQIYSSDISMILTNLYSDNNLYPDQVINRRQLVDEIYKGREKYGYKFAIYGPEFLKDLYPESYQGYCKYADLNQIFNSSRINLTTHVVGNREGYLNERTVTLIGSGALILIDQVKGLDLNLKPDEDCVVLDTSNPALQIAEILREYPSFSKIKKNVEKIRENHLWKCWAEKITSGNVGPRK